MHILMQGRSRLTMMFVTGTIFKGTHPSVLSRKEVMLGKEVCICVHSDSMIFLFIFSFIFFFWCLLMDIGFPTLAPYSFASSTLFFFSSSMVVLTVDVFFFAG